MNAKALKQVLYLKLFLFLAADFVDDVAVQHHYQAVSVANGVAHVVGHHKGRKLVALDKKFRKLQNLFGGLGVKRGGVLVKQKKLWFLQNGHQKRQSLALAAAQKANLCGHAVFQAQLQFCQRLLEQAALLLGDSPSERALAAAPVG